ncbi:MAG: Endoribonuclease YbeY [Microgenomates bacterium 39_7]|nr:MAG: Endoribonuclease YbeY [Microgenomates bacterium 39_7]
MIKINFNVSSRYAVNRKKLRQKAIEVLGNHKLDNVQLDVWIVGKRKIKELNEKHLKHKGTTDVLSFPQHERKKLDDFPLPKGEAIHLGEIVISFPEAVQTAKRYGKMVDDQLSFYLEHGLMHLLGYHHQ